MLCGSTPGCQSVSILGWPGLGRCTGACNVGGSAGTEGSAPSALPRIGDRMRDGAVCHLHHVIDKGGSDQARRRPCLAASRPSRFTFRAWRRDRLIRDRRAGLVGGLPRHRPGLARRLGRLDGPNLRRCLHRRSLRRPRRPGNRNVPQRGIRRFGRGGGGARRLRDGGPVVRHCSLRRSPGGRRRCLPRQGH